MNKNILWPVIVAVLVIIIGIMAFTKPKEVSKEAPLDVVDVADTSAPNVQKVPTNSKTTSGGAVKPTSSANPAPSDIVNTIPKTLRQLFASGQSLKCTFTDAVASTGVEGTVYLSGAKARADLSVTYNTTTIAHEMITGEKTYIWSDGVTTGAESTLASSATPTATPTKNGINADKKINYRCDKWVVDPSKFDLPPNVTFKI